MEQNISGFHLDEENHWVAELECGHGQHVRHDPPWMERPWVTTPEGRATRLGTPLNCKRCDEMGESIAKAVVEACREQLKQNYLNAGMSGLCEEGRWEAALGSLSTIDLKPVIANALKPQV